MALVKPPVVMAVAEPALPLELKIDADPGLGQLECCRQNARGHVVRRHDVQKPQPREVRRQHLGQTAATAARTVLDDHPFIAQCIAEVAHAGEEQRDADEAGAQRGRIVRRLGHPHPVLRRIEAVEGGGATVELIDEDEDQVAHGLLSPVTLSAYYPATPPIRQRPP
jgi:hypothetical protein